MLSYMEKEYLEILVFEDDRFANWCKVKTMENYFYCYPFFAVCFLWQKKATDTLRKVRHFMPNKIIDRTVFVYLINLYTYLIDKQ